MKRSRIRQRYTPDEVWLTNRTATIYRAKGRCERCGRDGSEVHHRQGRGGSNPHTLANLVLLCPECHRHVHARPSESYATGWLVYRNGTDDPAGVPLTNTRGRTFRLTDDGAVIAVLAASAPNGETCA